MLGAEVETGKRWSEETIRRLGNELQVPLDLEWGTIWSRFGKSQRAQSRTSIQLILSRGRTRKILWLDTDDLKSAVAESAQVSARARIRSQVEAGIADIVRRASLR